MSGKVFLMDSASGAIVKVASPLMLSGSHRPAEYQEIVKAVNEGTGSKRLREKYGTVINGVMCASRPLDFSLYAYATTLNTYHNRAIRVKVKDITGRPWQITGEDGPENVRRQITEFFKGAFGEQTFAEGMGNVWTDYEALGNGYLEVVPNAKGQPAELEHIPATETWIRIDGLGYVQQKNGEFAHFRRQGVEREAYAGLPGTDPLRQDGRTSIIHFQRYFPWSQFYGIPPVMPAWNRMALMVLETEYNLQFFNNNAVPDYAVILEGDWEEGFEDVIRQYFRTHLKGQAHKTLTLQAPQGGKVTFQQLTSDQAREGSFRLLRVDCRDEIIHAHGVPPQKVGIVETGKLGGNLATEQIREYKNSIVSPGQNKIATRLTRLIQSGFHTDKFEFEFEPYDAEDRKANADVDAIYLERKVVTPNEVRSERYPEREPLEDGDEPLSSSCPVPVCRISAHPPS